MVNEDNFENSNSQEVTELDLIYDAHDRLDALLNLLERKGIIVKGEYEAELEKVYDLNEVNE